MQRYIALLSGLPVGRETIDMETLRRLFVRLGFAEVEPYLTTGNIAFATAPVGVIAPLEAQISRYLRKSLKADGIWTFIRTPDELANIAANVPFSRDQIAADYASTFVVLLPEPPSERAQRQLRIRRNDVDVLELRGREIYWLRRLADSGSSAPPIDIAELLGMPATVRSLKTIERLAEMYGSPDAAARSRRVKNLDSTESPTESERSRP
ncbi:MAG: DUF1697 domain-containing protein [Gemmatimonadales bacterium]